MGILFLVFYLIRSIKIFKATSKSITSSPIIESLWLILPAFILVSLSTPTILTLYQSDQQHLFSKLPLKTLGIQWYWRYEVDNWYRLNNDNSIQRYIDIANNDRLAYLSREQELHLPRNTEIINIISASDVIHC